MGTGILSILLHQLPYNGEWLQRLSEILFALNVLLFIIFTVMSGLRFTMYPELIGALFRDKKGSFFLGAVPTGLFTIIIMIVLVCAHWGTGMITLAWTLWWINTVISIVVFFHLTFTV
jgi:tellurite resistance protein TehA-like permease